MSSIMRILGSLYRRLSLLGALSSNGPAAYQTPYQYRDRLQQLLPVYREEVSAVVDAYVLRPLWGKGIAPPQWKER